jgi:putative spermidine/putrescine transport system permease protein
MTASRPALDAIRSATPSAAHSTLLSVKDRPASYRLQALAARLGGALAYVLIGFFALNILLLIASVTVDSFSGGWFGSVLPQSFTLRHYQAAAAEHDLLQIILFTLAVTATVVFVSLILGLPAAYVMARRSFRGKPLVWALLLVPMMVPPMTYGIPLASMLYKYGLANSSVGVILVNLVPTLPFVIMILTPFVEQIDATLEAAARMLGARQLQIFTRVLAPLTVPGLLTAGILAAVRTIACFELTYLVSGATTQTLVVAVYNDAYGSGSRAAQQIDAMAVIYMVTTLVLLVIALVFVSPTQFVYRGRR